MRASVLDVLRGLLLLARFDAAGFGHLGGSAQDVLASLAPLVAFPLVFGVTAMLGDGNAHELAALLAAIAVLLVPLVTSEAMARRWQCDPAWGRFAVAFNWSQWTMTLVAVAVFAAAGLLAAVGLPRHLVAAVAMLAVLAYQLGLHWFLARRGLRLSAARATMLVLVMDLSSAAVLMGFLLLEGAEQQGGG